MAVCSRVAVITRGTASQAAEKDSAWTVSSPQWSGRTMARTGLRMMPTFPSSPLKFRTAGFPRYGFKAGVSAGAFPRAASTCHALSVCILPACPSLQAFGLRSVSENAVRTSTAIQAATPLYPRGPRSGPGYAVPIHQHLCGPIRPTRRHSAISLLCSLYALPSLCVSA
jgi:hypothetical protein